MPSAANTFFSVLTVTYVRAYYRNQRPEEDQMDLLRFMLLAYVMMAGAFG